jgi:hypothetical protein
MFEAEFNITVILSMELEKIEVFVMEGAYTLELPD